MSLRLLVISMWNDATPLPGGSGLPSLRGLILRWLERGNEVLWIGPKPAWTPVSLREITSKYPNTFQSRFVSNLFDTRSFWTRFSLYRAIRPFLYALLVAREISRHEKVDLVYGAGNLTAVAGFLSSRILRVPCVVRLYGMGRLYTKISLLDFMKHPNEVVPLFLPVEGLVVTADGSGFDSLMEQGFVKARNAISPPNGYDTQMLEARPSAKSDIRKRLGISETAYVVLSPVRLEFDKGVDRALRAFGEFVNKSPSKDSVMLVAGAGSEEKNLVQLAKDLNLSDHVRFLGMLPRNDLFELYSACDVCVLAARGSNFSNVLIESMASRVPLVVMGTTGLPREAKDMVFQCDNIGSMAEVLLRIRENRALADQISEKAREWLVHYLKPWPSRLDEEIEFLLRCIK